MPKGPKGERRPADTVQSAIKVARIATGEIEEDRVDQARSKGGKAGGKARAAALSPDKRRKIAEKASRKRWES